MTSQRDQKRAKFAAKNARRASARTWFLLAGVAVVLLAVAGYGLVRNDDVPAVDITAGESESGASIEMTDIASPAAVDGRISLSLSEIRENKLIWFSYGSTRIPVLAYIAPSGKVVTAISMCEPCQSDRFHIEGNELVCNACGTRWTLEDLRGISGGCPEYPPQVLVNQVSGDSVTVDEQSILNWKPRI